jgi:sporulation protein YlmC with PRC-barrel domain
MKAKVYLFTSLLLLAAPAFAQEPLEKIGTEPGTQAQPSQSATPPGNEPLERAGAQEKQRMGDQPAEVVFSELTEAQDGKKLVTPWNVPVDSVAEMDVFDANGKKIGQVDAVLQDKNGEVKGVAVGYGGFLGFGEKGAIVTLDQLKLKDGTLVTDINEDQLSQMPQFMKK